MKTTHTDMKKYKFYNNVYPLKQIIIKQNKITENELSKIKPKKVN